MKKIAVLLFILLSAAILAAAVFYKSFVTELQVGVDTKVIVLTVFAITIPALFILAFFVTKNLLNLYLEKKRKIAGYKFKTKLVTIFVGITMAPSALLFIIAGGLVTNYIDKWFTPQISKPLNEALYLAKHVYEDIRKDTLEDALLISKGVDMSEKYVVRWYTSVEPGMSETFKDAFNGKKGTEVITTKGGDIVRAVVPVINVGRFTEVLSVERNIPIDLSISTEEIQKAFKEYISIKAFKLPIKANYLFILGFFTLLIVFLALWIALKISKGITEPLESLAQATAKVAQGDLNTVVKARGEDEIGMLIDSFNKMIAKIKDAEISLQNAYLESDGRRIYVEHIIDNINAGVISLDSENRVITINDAACNILNIHAEDVLSKNYTDLIGHIASDELRKFIKEINLHNFHSKKDQLKVSINGRDMELRIFIVRLEDISKNAVGYVQRQLGLLVVFDDLTELIQAEKALTWQDVAKRITHEIKNPLTPIKLSAERLLKRWRNKDENFDKIIEKATSTIIREVDGLQRLVNEFSQLGKMPDIEIKQADIKSLINDVIDLYRDYEGVAITLDNYDGVKEIPMDQEQIKRVFINIIDNAIQAMDKNGKIDIKIREEDTLNNLIVNISDNGRGISKEDKEKLFQPYFSKRKNGTGLGLAISHRIIKEHKGSISVSDNKPNGTVFKIALQLRG